MENTFLATMSYPQSIDERYRDNITYQVGYTYLLYH